MLLLFLFLNLVAITLTLKLQTCSDLVKHPVISPKQEQINESLRKEKAQTRKKFKFPPTFSKEDSTLAAHIYTYTPLPLPGDILVDKKKDMVNFLTADIGSASHSAEEIEYDSPQVLAAARNTIPAAIHNRKSQVLIGPILVQVVLVIDITRSKLSLLDAIKADPNFPQGSNTNVFEGSQRVARRDIVRLPGSSVSNDGDEDDHEDNTNNTNNNNNNEVSENGVPTTTFKTPAKAIHKLILQDTNGMLVYAIELQKLNFLSMTTPLGSKLILNRVKFSRGVALLDPSNTTFLGGHIPHLVESTKQQLITYLKQDLEGASSSAN